MRMAFGSGSLGVVTLAVCFLTLALRVCHPDDTEASGEDKATRVFSSFDHPDGQRTVL